MQAFKTYKNGKFLEFHIIDDVNKDKICKYDLSNGDFIGYSGKIVKSLGGQLKDVDRHIFLESIQDEKYKAFLQACFNRIPTDGRKFKVATILKDVKHFSTLEQWFAAGLDDIIDPNFAYSMNSVHKVVIKFCKKFNFKLTNKNVNILDTAIDYLNSIMTIDFDKYTEEFKEQFFDSFLSGDYYYCNNANDVNLFKLNKDYGYDFKSMIDYFYKLYSFEGLDLNRELIRELKDYASMMSLMSVRKWDKYPKCFLTTHRITARNYNRMKQVYDEMKFEKTFDERYNWKYEDWVFICPKKSDEIKDEACQQQNCVASYIDRIIDGTCHIIFMRKKDDTEKSYITTEIRNYDCVQRYRAFNMSCSEEELDVINKYTDYLKKAFKVKKNKNNEDERLAG